MNEPKRSGPGLIVGLTGGMACGKSSVASIWRENGAYVLNSDETVHRLLAHDEDVRREIIEAFGDRVFDEAGRIDRSALGRLVFSDEAARQRLMRILHPRTKAIHLAQAAAYIREHPDGIVVIDSPLLFESGLDRCVDVTVTVAAPHETRIRRALKRAAQSGRPLTRDEAERRNALQMPLDEKRRRATFVIENDSTREHLRERAEAVWAELCRRVGCGC